MTTDGTSSAVELLEKLCTGRATLEPALWFYRLAAHVSARWPVHPTTPDLELVYHPDCPTDILERLSYSSYWKMQVCVASNNSTPVPVLHRLEQDMNVAVSNAARRTLARLRSDHPRTPARADYSPHPATRGGGDPRAQFQHAADPNCDVALLCAHITSSDISLRALVARNPNLPLDILIDLVVDPVSDVRAGALSNPNLPRELLEAQGLRELVVFCLMQPCRPRLDALPTLRPDELPMLLALGGDWQGTIGELLRSAKLIAV